MLAVEILGKPGHYLTLVMLEQNLQRTWDRRGRMKMATRTSRFKADYFEGFVYVAA